MDIDIVCFTGNSGLTDYSVSLGRALTRFANVRLVTAQSLPARFDAMGFAVDRVFRRSRHYPLDLFRFIARTIRRKPDWIMLQGPLKIAALDGLAVRCLRLLGIKATITVHDVLPHYVKPWSGREYAFYFQSFDKVIAHSAAAAATLRQMGVCQSLLTVPHGVYDIFDLTGISQTDARQQVGGLEPGDFAVLFFGHLEPRKGLMAFLDMAESSRGQTGLKFLIAGSNDLAKHGKGLAERLEEARGWPNTVIHDRRIAFECVEHYFSACDAVALPYLEGSTSGVLKLALAFGKPVVATRVGDLPEQIPEGGGLLVDCGDGMEGRFTHAIQQIRQDYGSFAEVMKMARSQADWRDIAQKTFAFLSS